MKLFKNHGQHGVGTVELSLLIIILAGLGLIGWYVVNSNHKTQTQLDKLAKTSDITTKNTQTSAAGSKFVFKELGVQITLPDALKGLSYKVENLKNNQGGTSPVLYLETSSMSNAVEQCYNQKVDPNSPPNFGAISKIDGQYSSTSSTDGPTEGPPLKQFDKFYISGSRPNGITTCINPKVDEGLAQHESFILFEALKEAFKTAQIVQ